jgi:hypothetical protein
LRFEPLHFADRLRVVNPEGDVGLVTLWSPREAVERKLTEVDPAILDPVRSRVAAIGSLYGDGMYAMLCNLLHNPQVGHLIALGTQAGPSTTDDLEALFARGLEDATLLERPVRRIPGTGRVFPADPAFDVERLRAGLTFHHLGRLSSETLPDALRTLLAELPRADVATLPPRIAVALGTGEETTRERQPSDVLGHQVARRRPLDVWEELVVRAMRFGREVPVGDGTRLELLNVKAVVREPADDPPQALEAFGVRPGDLRAYQRAILDGSPPDGIAYTYGHRLRGHTLDTLAEATALLRAEPATRRAYISLWDNAIDLHAGPGAATPCLTTVWLRIAEGALTLTATYRAHNLLSAWLLNVYGLMAVQRHVGDALGLPPGPVTVLSHALGINPDDSRYALARDVEARWTRDDDRDRAAGKASMREDPHGYFVVSADPEAGELIAEHRYEGLLVKTYRARRAETIMHEVAADMAVSLVSHALWLGGELRRHEQGLGRA